MDKEVKSVDVTDTPTEEIIKDVTDELQVDHIKVNSPISICIKNFKKKPIASTSLQFDTIQDISGFVNKDTFVYQILYNTINEKYLLRYYNYKLNFIDKFITFRKYKTFFTKVRT